MIRMASVTDAAVVAAIYEPYVSKTVMSLELEPPTPEEMARRIASTLCNAPWLVVEKDGEVLGYAYAARLNERPAYQWSLFSIVYVREDQRRRGLGRALYTSLFALLRVQGYCRLHASVTLPNEASVALHESFGFQPVGVYRAVGFKHGAWRDVGWWQLALRDDVDEPVPPLTMFEAEAALGWTAAFAEGRALLPW
jgi:phosphinothricin acetyltransferase